MPSFMECRKHSEQVLLSVIQTAVVRGRATGKIECVPERFRIAGEPAGHWGSRQTRDAIRMRPPHR